MSWITTFLFLSHLTDSFTAFNIPVTLYFPNQLFPRHLRSFLLDSASCHWDGVKGCWTSGTFTLCPPLLLHALSVLLLLSRQDGKRLGIHCPTENFVHWCQISSCFEGTREHDPEKLRGGLTVEGQVDSSSQRPGGPRKAVDNPSWELLVPGLGFLRRASDTHSAEK